MDRSTDLWTFGRDNFHLQEYLGALETRENTVYLPVFELPNAQAVDLIGDFTDWEARNGFVMKEASGKSLLFRCKREGRYIQVFGDSTKWSSRCKKSITLVLWMKKRPNTGSIIKTIQREKLER